MHLLIKALYKQEENSEALSFKLLQPIVDYVYSGRRVQVGGVLPRVYSDNI